MLSLLLLLLLWLHLDLGLKLCYVVYSVFPHAICVRLVSLYEPGSPDAVAIFNLTALGEFTDVFAVDTQMSLCGWRN